MRDDPVLAAIARALTWLEDLISLLSGPFLTVGAGIALIALLTDGAVLVTDPWLINAYGISQAVGVDGMLLGSAFLLARAWSQRNVLGVIGNGILVILLGYVVYLGGFIFNFSQTFHVPNAQAFADLNITPTNWLWQRTAVGVFLVILSGLRRYIPKQPVNVAERLADLDAQAQIAARERELAAERLAGWRRVAQRALARPVDPPPDPTPPDGPSPPGEVDEQPSENPAEVAPQPLPVGAGVGGDPVPALMTTVQLRDYARKIFHHQITTEEAVTIVKGVPGAERLANGKPGQPWAAPREAVIARLHAMYDTSAAEA
jgi:hypothetical protein